MGGEYAARLRYSSGSLVSTNDPAAILFFLFFPFCNHLTTTHDLIISESVRHGAISGTVCGGRAAADGRR